MEPTADELAGVVDAFGALTRSELRTAVLDLAARAGHEVRTESLEGAIDEAVEAYYLVSLEPAVALAESEVQPVDDLLLPGPAALPSLPDGGEDLPHLVDIEPRSVDRAAASHAVASRLRADATSAIEAEDSERTAALLDVCYEVEAWGPVELDDVKEELSDAGA